MVLGIVGKKHAGKDTFANYVRKYNSNYNIDYYAARLKEVCAEIFPISIDYFKNPSLKEVPFDTPIAIDEYLTPLSNYLDLPLFPKGLIATNPRLLLQYVGTEYVRAERHSYWTDYLKNKIQDANNKNVIISDVRFYNEAQVIHEMANGILIKIVRTSQLSLDGHKSEREQESIQCPTLYINDGEFLLSEAIAALFAYEKVGTALDLIKRSADWKSRKM